MLPLLRFDIVEGVCDDNTEGVRDDNTEWSHCVVCTFKDRHYHTLKVSGDVFWLRSLSFFIKCILFLSISSLSIISLKSS